MPKIIRNMAVMIFNIADNTFPTAGSPINLMMTLYIPTNTHSMTMTIIIVDISSELQ